MKISLRTFVCSAVLGLPSVQKGQDAPEVASSPEWSDTRVETAGPVNEPALPEEGSGFFPTTADLALLGDRDYARTGALNELGPDALMQNSMGLFEYESGPQDFYARNREALAPINQVLGIFTPNKGLTTELPGVPLAGATLDGSFPIFTRTFEPRNAHLKLGPLAFDLVWLGAGALWSDYSGADLGDGRDDGWITAIDVALRGTLQLTDSLHLSFLADLVYLPGTNEVAFRSLNGSYPNAVAEIFYQTKLGSWDFLFFDQFVARPGIDIFANLDNTGVDWSGRYQFGFYGREDQASFYDNELVWFANQIAGRASSMVGASDWRFLSAYDHFDFWQSFDFDNHQSRDTLALSLGYEGNNIPFAPLLIYEVTTPDQFDSFYHRAQLQLTGRITENVRLLTRGGYLWTSGLDSEIGTYLWDVVLDHQFSQRGSHSFGIGQQFFEDAFSPEILLTNYLRYTVNYQIAKTLTAGAYFQQSDGEVIVSSGQRQSTGDQDVYTMAGTLSFRPLDFTQIIGLVAYERSNTDYDSFEIDRMIYRIQASQRLASRLTLETLYQFEDFDSSASFDEHLVSMSLRWYF